MKQNLSHFVNGRIANVVESQESHIQTYNEPIVMKSNGASKHFLTTKYNTIF